MARCTILSLLVCVVLALSPGPGARAAETGPDCWISPELDMLLDELRMLNLEGGAAVAVPAERLRSLIGRVREAGVSDRLTALGLGNLGVAVYELLFSAEQIAGTGRIEDAGVLQARIRAVDRLGAIACGGAEPQAGSGSLARLGAYLDGLLRSDGRDENGPPVRVLLWLVGLASAGWVGLSLGRWLLRWIFAVAYSRKACMIAATVRIGGARIPGQIVLLGRKGCRFLPRDEDMRLRLWKLAETDETWVQVGDDVRIPAFVHGVYARYGSLLFLQPLPKRTQGLLFSQSVLAPYYVKMDMPKPNVERRARRAASVSAPG